MAILFASEGGISAVGISITIVSCVLRRESFFFLTKRVGQFYLSFKAKSEPLCLCSRGHDVPGSSRRSELGVGRGAGDRQVKGAIRTALRPSSGVDCASFMGPPRRLQGHLNPLFPHYLSLFFICSIVVLGLAGLVLGAYISLDWKRHQKYHSN
jgi:hypothetical protein